MPLTIPRRVFKSSANGFYPPLDGNCYFKAANAARPPRGAWPTNTCPWGPEGPTAVGQRRRCASLLARF
ncbi:UNVERIFIED_CONTAM: hypothetical protein Slati_4579600 [Sesamum latifolium]|uniref:Uncharacterized protein n=1 Tax=Sesamum latifolium TaxID=2727402 RepID=A0AAW2SFL3_9LAMI